MYSPPNQSQFLNIETIKNEGMSPGVIRNSVHVHDKNSTTLGPGLPANRSLILPSTSIGEKSFKSYITPFVTLENLSSCSLTIPSVAIKTTVDMPSIRSFYQQTSETAQEYLGSAAIDLTLKVHRNLEHAQNVANFFEENPKLRKVISELVEDQVLCNNNYVESIATKSSKLTHNLSWEITLSMICFYGFSMVRAIGVAANNYYVAGFGFIVQFAQLGAPLYYSPRNLMEQRRLQLIQPQLKDFFDYRPSDSSNEDIKVEQTITTSDDMLKVESNTDMIKSTIQFPLSKLL